MDHRLTELSSNTTITVLAVGGFTGYCLQALFTAHGP